MKLIRCKAEGVCDWLVDGVNGFISNAPMGQKLVHFCDETVDLGGSVSEIRRRPERPSWSKRAGV